VAPVLFFFSSIAYGQYAGATACKGCHAREWETQARSGHARALSGGPTEWNFGAGEQAITPVSKLDNEYYLEHGVSDYKGVKNLTPGHKDAKGARYRITDPESKILRCFQCHSTGPPRLSDDMTILPAENGVRCEACHGPGQDHIARGGGKFAIFNPGSLNGSGMNEFCGNCHRKPAKADDDTNWSDPWNTRHEPVYLDKSVCFQKSKGALSCITCHSPHAPLAHSGYDAICRNCHAKPAHKTVVSAQKSCISCHMPKVTLQKRLAFTNHWIGIYRSGNLRP
jgi:hypothetical protein